MPILCGYRWKVTDVPIIMAICAHLMTRVHEFQQSELKIYFDVSSLFHVSGHIPLGIGVMSVESEKCIYEAITLFKHYQVKPSATNLFEGG